MAANVSEVDPIGAWQILKTTPDAVMIDVRTRPEWAFVGVPDLGELGRTLVLSEWRKFPDMSVNQMFVQEILDQMGGSASSTMLFLCRSGVRSLEAARYTAHALGEQGMTCECINVAEGFEGDLNTSGHRGAKNGWKVSGLAWRQS